MNTLDKNTILLNKLFMAITISTILCIISSSWLFYRDYSMFVIMPLKMNHTLGEKFFKKELLYFIKLYAPLFLLYIFGLIISIRKYKIFLPILGLIWLQKLPAVFSQTFQPLTHTWWRISLPLNVDGLLSLILCVFIYWALTVWALDSGRQYRQNSRQQPKN